MFNKNYWRILAVIATFRNDIIFYNQNYTSYVTWSGSLVDTGGINRPWFIYAVCTGTSTSNINTSGTVAGYNVRVYKEWGVLLGTDDTEASVEDTSLYNDVSSNYTRSVTIACAPSETEDSLEVLVNVAVTDTSNTERTIKEIGFFKQFYFGTEAYNGSSRPITYTRFNIMLARVVLDEPITVPAGGSATFSVKITNR